MEPSAEQEELPVAARCIHTSYEGIKKNKCLFILIVLIFDIILGVGTYFYIANVYYKQRPPCSTPACVLSTAEIMKKNDLQIDPCDDFYSFACSNYEAKHFVPTDRSDYNQFVQLQEFVDETLTTTLVQPILPSDDPPVILAKNLYHACMNAKLVEANSLPILRGIYQKLGGWPVAEIDNWNETAFDWKNLTYQFMRNGLYFQIFFKISLIADNSHHNSYQVAIFQPDDEYLKKALLTSTEDRAMEAYYKYMVEVAEIFGAPFEQAYKDMQDVINFNVKLVDIIQPMGQILNDTSALKRMKIGDLQEIYPYVSWLEFLKTFYNNNIQFTYNDHVIVVSQQYLKNLGNLFKETPKRVIANYMFWQAAHDLTDYLNYNVRDAKIQFLKIHNGIVDHLPRTKLCLKKALELDLAIGLILTRTILKTDIAVSIDRITDDIKNQLYLSIKAAEWMDIITQEQALIKAGNINVNYEYPREFKDKHFVEHYYDGLFLDDENYLKLVLQINIFRHQKSYIEYNLVEKKKTTLKDRWLSVTSVKPFYNPTTNVIELPIALLEVPFFNNNQSQYLNYAGIGSIIGHEFMYAFDSEGQQYDTNGNLVSWWQPKTREAYLDLAQCMVDQYSNIAVSNTENKLDGYRTLDENIADNAAVQFAYKAYHRWAQFHRDELKLPGLDFNPFQLFWIAFGQQFCAVQTKEEIKSIIYESPHVLPKYRVNVPLMNSNEFARDFNCPLGSKMNPEYKCKVW